MDEEYARLRRQADEAREALAATRWWQSRRRREASERYKLALLRGALWELANPGKIGEE